MHALLDGRITQVHSRLVPQRRDQVTVKQLERVWGRLKPPDDHQATVAIVDHEIAASGAVVADVAIVTPDSSTRLRMVVLPSGQLGGFTAGPPGQG